MTWKNTMGPQIEFSEQLHAMKYRQSGETFRDSMNRVARAMADENSSRHYHEFRDILLSMRFSPAGRILAAMGSSKEVTPFNCYVSGVIPDSFVNTDNEYNSSIMDRATEAATTMRMGGGIGYDFSTLRPKGALIKKLQSSSSGAVSFMHVFDSVGRATSSAGHRRGAQMGVLRVDHPDIIEFINAKHKPGLLEGFNMSVGCTDRFMEAVAGNKKFDLEFDGEIYQTVYAQELWEMIMRSTWDWADPGVLFLDTINRMNNLWYCETIAATNPCGEQPLPPYGACLLGSINLVKYLSSQQLGKKWTFDYDQLIIDIPTIVRALDNVVDRALFPLEAQKNEAHAKRRMGIGVMGLANTAETMGLSYGSKEFLKFEKNVLTIINAHSYRASSLLAKEKGAFPLFDKEQYLQGEFIKSLDPETFDMIVKYGMRNSHVTSIAPTGTISMANDNISSGIEPVFSISTDRPVNTPNGPVIVTLEDYAFANFGTKPKVCEDVTANEHVAVLLTAAKLVDSAVSKTCNVTGKMPWNEFKSIYSNVWEGGGKGCTTFNIDGQKMALLKKTVAQNEGASCTYDSKTGTRSCE